MKRLLRWLALVLLLVVSVLLVDAWTALGTRATGERLARMQRSPQWSGGAFENPQPLWNDAWGMLTGALHISDDVSPRVPLQPQTPTLSDPPTSGLRVTWVGHSTTLVEIDGKRLLTDPVWSDRVSPSSWIGPRRWYPPPIALEALPPIDAVLISHDHFDHLDHGTIVRMRAWPTPFIVPLGIGAHLEYWGISKERIIELDWWEQTTLGDVTVVCTPSRHASGRMVIDFDAKLWGSFVMIGPQHRVFFSGDTGLFPAMKDIGEKYGPMDLAMIEVGQYHRAWPDWHIGPEQAVLAYQQVRARNFLPIHWGLLALAYHGWTEPPERVLAATGADERVATPRPGESFEPTVRLPQQRWWPQLPFDSAADAPIVSTKLQ